MPTSSAVRSSRFLLTEGWYAWNSPLHCRMGQSMVIITITTRYYLCIIITYNYDKEDSRLQTSATDRQSVRVCPQSNIIYVPFTVCINAGRVCLFVLSMTIRPNRLWNVAGQVNLTNSNYTAAMYVGRRPTGTQKGKLIYEVFTSMSKTPCRATFCTAARPCMAIKLIIF